MDDAVVACYNLGYPPYDYGERSIISGRGFTYSTLTVATPLDGSNFEYRMRNQPIITDVMCNGTEYQLLECSFAPVSFDDGYCLGGYNIAGVQCTDGEYCDNCLER